MSHNKTAGFHVVEMLLIVAIIAVLGFVGWRVWEAQTSTQQVETAPSQSEPAQAPEVNNTSDLDEASSTLDNVNLDDSDKELSELEKELGTL